MSNIASWKNFYAISGVGTVAENIKYAKQMGYDYIVPRAGKNPSDYINNQECAGLKFYFIDPHGHRSAYYSYPGYSGNYYPREINVGTGGPVYTQAQKDWYNNHMVWGTNAAAWPYNLATNYHPTNVPTKFGVMWDFQQQAVIDLIVENAILLFKSYENPNLPFTFAGYMIDTPKLNGEFLYLDANNNDHFTTIKHWTGTESGLLHAGITHEYATYMDGTAAYYKKLNLRIRQEFPNNNAKWIIDPSRIYNSIYGEDEWVYGIKSRSDKAELAPDMITQEGPVTDFIDNPLNFTSGVNITKDMVGCTQSSMVKEDINRLIAAKAGINGAWYNWFMRFGGAGTMPAFQSITEVYSRLKLIRCVPNWDNLNNIPLSQRSWDGQFYRSPNSYISSNLIYSKHWKTQEIYIVFNTNIESITLPGNPDIKRVDVFFIPTVSGLSDFNKVGDVYTLKSTVTIPIGGITYVATGLSSSVLISGGFIISGSCLINAFHAASNRDVDTSGGFIVGGILPYEKTNIYPKEYNVGGGFILGGTSEIEAFSAAPIMDVDTSGGFILGGISQVDGIEIPTRGGFILGGYMDYEYFNYPKPTQHKGRITGMVFRRIQKS